MGPMTRSFDNFKKINVLRARMKMTKMVLTIPSYAEYFTRGL